MDLQYMLNLEGDEKMCPACRDKVIEIAQRLSTMRVYEQYPELKGIQDVEESTTLTRSVDRKTGQAIYDNLKTVDDPQLASRQDTKNRIDSDDEEKISIKDIIVGRDA